jgi:hypothetical protein
MGRVVLGVMVWFSLPCSLAIADPDDAPPTPTPAPPAINWYATMRPTSGADASAGHTWRTIQVNRSGLFALGGVAHADAQFFGRVDLGAPMPTRTFPRLRVLVSIASHYATEGSGADKTSTSDLRIAPKLQYDWRLPVDLRRGDLVLVAGAGLERAQHWVKLPDQPYWPSKWESSAFYAYTFEVALQFRARNGVLISFAPLGVVVPFTRPDPPDARFMQETPNRAYEVSLAAGYQLP